MKALIFVAAGLMLLSPIFCQSGMENDVHNLAEPTLPIKTFRGAPSNSFEEFPLSAIEGWTEGTTTTIKFKCPEESVSNLQVNNATMGYLRSSLSTKLIPAIYILVFVVGVPANVVTLWRLFFRTRSICMTIFYTNLAIADFLFCVTLPFKIAYHLNGNNWVFGEVMCRATTVIFYGNMYCSILLLACISISRYLAIVHPFTYRVLPKRYYAFLTCGFVWATVFLYMLPFFILKQEYYLVQQDIKTCHDVHNTCESSSPFQLYYFISLAFFGFLIPFVVIIYCYTAIIQTLNAYDDRWLCYVKASLLVLVIFTICFAPSNIILIIHHANYYYNNTDGLYFIYLIALCLGSLNSCLDPLLYFLMSKIIDHSTVYLTMVKSS
ncbi:proteinase-activated receptor 3 [Canis lupus baileyi]|uniref:Coagulation factor II thrombin receptor like 2 n=3 Tax=Canis lupus TaxID=9612 RepID=A0A8C0Q0Y1_CANLF|nr:proteinase-activated receptor 3 [Canis lupus dingo]XP_038388442.1 proteinase-activated receptor 3 [Canis lupus familiaris]XP_038516933.1 proteinase-activated receptor 3 [Canis lupus familiaris]XP_849866.1 proteinase-activated receptor 3 [Canis lupus familiaris]|eukprot:XP_849866.1 proteinase-activated receptor 3 [Canis lupus familiaris]